VRSTYFLCTSPRSGSNLLCEALWALAIAGNPREYFGRKTEGFWRRRLGVAPGTNFIDGIVQATQSENGVFGAKVFWLQFQNLLTVHLDGQSASLAEAFPGLRYVWLRRRDQVAQAVSFYKAFKTDLWAGSAGDGPDPRASAELNFSLSQIEERLLLLQEWDKNWEAFFHQGKLEPLTIWYHDLAGDYEQTVRRVLAHIGVSYPPAAPIPPPQLKKQADEISADWVQRVMESKALE
jgi:trehalose 2-sulfotransferase